MKRAIILAAACLVLLTASAAALGLNDLNGAWQLVSVDCDGISHTPEEANVSLLLTLNADGSGTLDDGSCAYAVSWTLDGTTVAIDSGSVLCAYDAAVDQLLIERSGLTLRLSRADL